MSASELKRRVKIQQLQVDLQTGQPPLDENGAEIRTWVDLFEAWAKIAPMSGAARFSAVADQHYSQMDTIVTIRYRSAVKAEMRVVHRAEYFSIEAVRNKEQDDNMLELICRTLNDGEETR